MKTLLIALCALSLLKGLQTAPKTELTEGSYETEKETEGCAVDFNKLESEIGSIKQILEQRLNDVDTETPSTQDEKLKQVNREIEELTKIVTELLASSPNENIEDLITSNNVFVEEKIKAFQADVKDLMTTVEEQKANTKGTNIKHETMLNEISKNVEETLKKLSEEQHKAIASTENMPDMLKKFEDFGEQISKLLATKFEEQAQEIKNLKTQNELYLTQLKELSQRLEQNIPAYKEQTEQIEKVLSEKNVGLTDHMENLNATLVSHFKTHVEKLNAHETTFNDIKLKIGELENKYGTECAAKIVTNKELLDNLVTRFDKATPYWQQLENYTPPKKACNELPEQIDLVIQIDD